MFWIALQFPCLNISIECKLRYFAYLIGFWSNIFTTFGFLVSVFENRTKVAAEGYFIYVFELKTLWFKQKHSNHWNEKKNQMDFLYSFIRHF